MTYQLARLRLAGIGDRAARFTDLTVDLTAAEGDSPGEPVDSILWLRNGGGKSSLLSLFFALLLPLRKDFMGKTVKRYLEDYIASGDTSHTVAEWVAQSGDALLPPQRLITGAVYEWVDRRKPVDPDRDRDKLRGWYYTFFAIPKVLELDLLPIEDEAGRRRSMSDYVRRLQELAASRPQEFLFTITDQRGLWTEALTSRNLDSALFRYQKEMNHSEGGVAELFNFPTTDKFIDFLIDLTVDSAQPDLVAANLRKIVDVLGRKPDLLVDRDFCAEMAGRLDLLAEQHVRAQSAASEAANARTAAARLAGAFRAAAAARKADSAWFAEERDRLRASATKLDSERNRTNDTANEMLRIAALHRQASALAAWDSAKKAADQTKAENRAWEAVDSLAELREAERGADDVHRQLEAEEQQTAPLRADRDDAAAALRARLKTLADEEEQSAGEATTAAGEAKSDAEREAAIAKQNHERAAKASTRAEDLRGEIIEIGQAVEAAVARGDLPEPTADPVAVVAGVRATRRGASEQLLVVRGRRAARPAQRAQLALQATSTAAERSSRTAERDLLVASRGKLISRVDELAADARLGELMELEADGRIDLWSEAADVRAALTHAAATAEVAIVDTRVDAADDNRALESLRTDDFLPTTRDAQRTAQWLVDQGIPARSGWHLLRDLVAESQRASVLGNPNVAQLAAGVVVADGDTQKAFDYVATGDLQTVAHVSVCSATQLQQVLSSAEPEWLAVPNDPALFDPLAAETARVAREVRREEQDHRIAVLHEQATADRALLNAVETMLYDCPPGHLDELERAIEEGNSAIEELEAREKALGEEIEEIDRCEADDAENEAALSDQIADLVARIERLVALATRTAELSELARSAEQLERDAADCSDAAQLSEERATAFRSTEQAALGMATEHKLNLRRYLREAAEISLLDTDRQPGPASSTEPLSALQSRFKELDSRWQAQATQSVLAERLQNLTARAARAARTLETYPQEIRDRAAELLVTAEGQDEARRGAARDRSREDADEAQRRLSRTGAELEQAQGEVKTRSPRDRARHAQLEIEPATEAEARRLAVIESDRATELSGQATALLREAGEAGDAATEASSAAQVLGQQASRLGDAAEPTEIPQGVPAYDGDAAEADLTQHLARLNTAVETTTATDREVATTVATLRRVAAESRFATIPDAIRDRFTADDTSVLAERAATRANDMRVRRTTIEGQLADIGRDQQLVVTEIAGLVRDVLGTLDSAHRHSKLPGTLGTWGNEHFLRITFPRPASEEDLHARIDTVVDRIVAEKSKPEGISLLKRCVHEAVAPRGFTVKVLKPNSDLAVEPVEVTQLGKFSGGEKLTVCVALYCTLARLRAVNRGRRNGTLGGTLVLDNPLGTASHVALLRLQRDVAAAHGVQLVYTTGVEDLGAVGQFPNVLRLRNAPGALRTRRYVVLDDRYEAEMDGITGARLRRDESQR